MINPLKTSLKPCYFINLIKIIDGDAKHYSKNTHKYLRGKHIFEKVYIRLTKIDILSLATIVRVWRKAYVNRVETRGSLRTDW